MKKKTTKNSLTYYSQSVFKRQKSIHSSPVRAIGDTSLVVKCTEKRREIGRERERASERSATTEIHRNVSTTTATMRFAHHTVSEENQRNAKPNQKYLITTENLSFNFSVSSHAKYVSACTLRRRQTGETARIKPNDFFRPFHSLCVADCVLGSAKYTYAPRTHTRTRCPINGETIICMYCRRLRALFANSKRVSLVGSRRQQPDPKIARHTQNRKKKRKRKTRGQSKRDVVVQQIFYCV